MKAYLDYNGSFLQGKELGRSALERFTESEMINGESNGPHFQKRFPLESGCMSMPVQEVSGAPGMSRFGAGTGKEMKKPQYYIEEEQDTKENTLKIRGWAVDRNEVKVLVYDRNKKKISCSIQKTGRLDVVQMYKECPVSEKNGFYIEVRPIPEKLVYLVFQTKERKAVYRVETAKAAILRKTAEKYVTKGWTLFNTYGPSALGAKVYRKFFTDKEKPVDYQKWIQKHLPGPGELEKQEKPCLKNSLCSTWYRCTKLRRSFWKN